LIEKGDLLDSKRRITPSYIFAWHVWDLINFESLSMIFLFLDGNKLLNIK
jgi:hypothetical protein